MKLIIKHERKVSVETINQALSMHGLIATNTGQEEERTPEKDMKKTQDITFFFFIMYTICWMNNM